ncbi:MAG: Ppx/GppA family phosphatase [Alphaproteobacteria bacterium]|jgi:exopolyphosphatase/guanosine-5'-triphosphate,3'-diphosphate pyrophosphatase|nr:Ppx/GppA family phosphatase [Alphaproteobacteria bacterium]
MTSATTETARRPAGSSVGSGEAPFAVVDIGSNSVRLVIYDRLSRSPVALFNEKALCAIGRNMVTTGLLDEEGSDAAIAAMGRFREIASGVGARIEAVATAAVRDAKNGNTFVARARDALGAPIRILTGEEEARLASEGVLAAIPDADGIAGDLGGGSLELAFVSGGKQSTGVTLPFGPLRLMDMSEGKIERARAIVDQGLEKIPGLDKLKGKALYAVGGVWRNIARIHMEDAQHEIRVLHHYEISRERAVGFANFLSGLSRRSLEAITSVSRRRAEAIPYGAVVMERLLKAAKLDRVVISAFGLREGVLFARLGAEERARDPLIASCEDMATRLGRDPGLGRALDKWTAPLFAGHDKSFDRLRRAACYLGDTGWRGHPDHRAEQTFTDVLNAPFIGIDHDGRALLALTMFHRYGGEYEKTIRRIQKFVGDDAARTARTLGLALRAALVMAGPAPDILSETSAKITPSSLLITIPKAHQALVAEAITKRLQELAGALDRTMRIELR